MKLTAFIIKHKKYKILLTQYFYEAIKKEKHTFFYIVRN